MPRTQLSGRQVSDGSIQRRDLDTITAGQAVITKVTEGTGVSITSTGIDPGTGDVVINVNRNIDGGSPDSIYLITQKIEGGVP